MYPYRLESLLVGIAQLEPSLAAECRADWPQERATGQAFADGLTGQRQRIGQYLGEFRRRQGPVAVLGAGHLACAFINYLQLQEHLAFVVDDNPHKQGLFMPGSRLPIRPALALREEKFVCVC